MKVPASEPRASDKAAPLFEVHSRTAPDQGRDGGFWSTILVTGDIAQARRAARVEYDKGWMDVEIHVRWSPYE